MTEPFSRPATTEATPQPASLGARLYLVALVGILGTGFAYSQFLRNSVGVLAPELGREIGLPADALGFLTGAFFLSFAAAQLPIGVAFDRYGPRLCTGLSIMLAAAGCALFAAADDAGTLAAARTLMGLGCAALLMGPLTVISRWFSAAIFATLASVIMVMGNIGTIISTEPLALAADLFGRRSVFVVSGVIAVALGVAVLVIVRDAPAGHPYHARAGQSWSESLRGVVQALRVGDVGPVLVMNFAAYPVFAAVLGLWGPAFLADIHGLDMAQRGRVMLLAVGGLIVGTMCLGPLDRLLDTRKWLVVTNAVAASTLLTVLAIRPELPMPVLTGVLIGFGFFSGGTAILIAHGRALFSEPLVGRGLTLLNTAVMAGVFVLHWAAGIVIELAAGPAGAGDPLPAHAYQACFAMLAACLAAALAVYLTAGDRKPSAD